MTPGDAARVLTKAAAFDQRTIGAADAAAWFEALADVDATDALAAVTHHYRDSRDRLMPADVRRLAIEARNRRHTARESAIRAIAAGPIKDRSAEVTALVQQVISNLPVVESDRIHERAKARARRERGRPEQPRHRERKQKANPKPEKPNADEVATMARRYLVDGWDPKAVAEKFGIERRWCERLARRPETVAAREKAERELKELASRRIGSEPQ